MTPYSEDQWGEVLTIAQVPIMPIKPSDLAPLENILLEPIDNHPTNWQVMGMNAIKQPRYYRALGSLFGAACGDAMGATLEFRNPDGLPDFPDLAVTQKDMLGGGAFMVDPGQITDDTQMAVALARVITATEGKFDAATVLDEYQFWGRFAFDVGGQTSRALFSKFESGYPGYEMYLKGNTSGAGNGALMRSTPIAVAFHNDPARLREWAIGDALVTHGDPLAVLANVGYLSACAFGINGGDIIDACDIAKEAILLAAKDLERFYTAEDLERATQQLLTDLEKAQELDPGLFSGETKWGNGPLPLDADGKPDWSAIMARPAGSREPDIWKTKGFVRTAFRYAFWHLNHSGYREAIVDAASRGGDSDTNAAIIGGLMGAFVGIEEIPEEWLDKVRSCRPGGQAQVKFQGVTAPAWDDYFHPNMFQAFAHASVF